MKEIWSFVHDKLAQNQNVYLLVVIDNHGSSPGQPGFKMAVADDGMLKGSVGGGQTEYRLVELARKELNTNQPKIILKREIHKDDVKEDKSGMICSGEQWVAFYPLDHSDLPLVSEILSATNKGIKGLLQFDNIGFSLKESERIHHQHKNPVTSPEEWHYEEETGNENRLYIFGAGHVGLALSRIMSYLDFTIHIFDDRKDLPTLLENTSADHSDIINYKNTRHLVDEGDGSYVVIMTFGHKSDEIVLRQFLGMDLKYLGMMGSAKKVARIFENLRQDGISEQSIEKIHAPIGIPIESQTPYEIAVSIAAEIISVKNNSSHS
jgi:xanthine dehydrogenase accessory factor